MPAAGGIKKSELYINSPVKRPPVIRGNPLECYLRPLAPLIKVVSYVALWKKPALSAYTFIWLNLCMLLHVTCGLTTLLSATVAVFMLTLNTVLLEYSCTRSNVMMVVLWSLLDVRQEELLHLPGSEELSQMLVNSANSVCNVFLNIRDSSRQGQTQFCLALCTTVAMLTIILTYLATTTTLLLLFWAVFCFPAAKHHQLHKKITQQQIVITLNMSMYMLYNLYLAVVQALSTSPEGPDIQEITPGSQDEFAPSLHDEYTREMSEPAYSLRSTTMSYFRGLPSTMTLNWRGMFSRAPPASPSQPTQQSTSTESDSDFGIEDIEEETRVKGRTQTMDTLGSNAELEFPSLDRKDSLDYEGTQTLAEGLDPRLLYDEEQSFTLDTMGGEEFTLGGAQRLNLLDAVTETDDEASEIDDLETDGRVVEPSPSPEFGESIRSNNMSRDDTLDGKQFMLNVLPRPPAGPKPAASHHRVKQQSETSVETQGSVETTDTEFYVISDEDIRAAEDELELSRDDLSSTGSSGSLRERLTGRIKRLSRNDNPQV